MSNVNDVLYFLDVLAPFDTSMGFDNTGILVGGKNKKVSKILLTLDVTREAVEKAISIGAELIVSHHPVIFNPMKRISDESIQYMLIRNDISVISAHTNLDKAEGGVNDALALKLGLSDIQSVESEDPEELGLARIGSIAETDIRSFALYVKIALGADGVEFSGKSPVKNVCVVGGSGGGALLDAKKAGADTLVTGEAKYNHFSEALEMGMNLVVAGHYHTENVVLEPLKDYMLSTLHDVTVEIFNCKFTEKV
ncbi:MAG: Nif3-like dinuclear metal center hexameric protein [Clostridia bacterium]|nr:Nif3-like dinuclear metal center hexameric protein [Clostridia bacterium]